MLQFECYQKLLKMPGVFVFTWDNCQYGETYQHRQIMVTNMVFLAALARDCPNTPSNKVHDHLTIGFGADLSTKDVSAYAWEFCRQYAKRVKEFVTEPVESRCVHCLPQGESKMIYNRREAMRRCAEQVDLHQEVDSFEIGLDEMDGEIFLKVQQPTIKDAIGQTHLGARCTLADAVTPENSKK